MNLHLQLAQRHLLDMRIGIFWIYKDEVIGRTVPLSAGGENYPGLVDSPDNHVEVWDEPRFLSVHPELNLREYQEIPRGRVLWNMNNRRAIVYMDSTLHAPKNKTRIATFFEFEGCEVQWETDPHYTTKPEDIFALFDDD